MKRPPKAYSYTRFSTPEQAEGDSEKRQTLAAQRWAAQYGIELDTELKLLDRGKSAFDGSNVERGALGEFLRAVEDGIVPKGSFLLVESLDRVSRQKPWKAVQLMASIAEEGVVVVDMSDGGKQYSKDTLDHDSTALILMVVRFMRANEESALKSARVAAARLRAREAFASEQPLSKAYTRQLPGWLRWNDATKAIEAIPERAATVQKVFELADSGMGQHSIAGWLNENAGEPWGRGKRKGKHWHRSYVRKILTNRAVIGEFVPHVIQRDPDSRRKTRKPLEPIRHRLPAIVDQELFERVSSRVATPAARGKHAGAKTRSLFAGVLRCCHCGSAVTRVSKGQHVYLVCSEANRKPRSCRYETVPYGEAEQEFVRLTERMIEEAPRGNDTGELENQISSAQAEVDMLLSTARELLAISIEEKSHIARQNLREGEQRLSKAEERVRELRQRRDNLARVSVLRRLEALESALTTTTLDVPQANRLLREAVDKIVMFAAEGRLEVHWRHAADPQEVPFFTKRFGWSTQQTQANIQGDGRSGAD